jgi:hypothetical protein
MSEEAPLRIVKLEAANVKRLVAVEIKPDGSLVVVGGKNGAGKTSVLDSIAYALGGREALCDEPLRQGAKKGHVTVDLGEFTVRRTFTPEGGGTLTVESREGAVFRSPQAMLDRLLGRLSFDPLAFARMEPKQQRETLRQLVGLDFAALDAARAKHFEERTAINRDARMRESRLVAMPEHAGVPAEPIAMADLVAELDAAAVTERAASDAEMRAKAIFRDVETETAAVASAEATVARLQRDLDAARQKAADAKATEEAMRTKAVQAHDLAGQARAAVIDPAPIRQRIADAEGTNAKARANAERARVAAELEEARARAGALTALIDALDADKAMQLAEAKFPVEGLAFDEGGVRLNGVPFSQASAAEQLRVSVAMGLAMNPRLRVLLIRDGSLLDDDSLALVAAMAAESDAQVWMERVGDGAECSVVIEDGAVRAAEVAS